MRRVNQNIEVMSENQNNALKDARALHGVEGNCRVNNKELIIFWDFKQKKPFDPVRKLLIIVTFNKALNKVYFYMGRFLFFSSHILRCELVV